MLHSMSGQDMSGHAWTGVPVSVSVPCPCVRSYGACWHPCTMTEEERVARTWFTEATVVHRTVPVAPVCMWLDVGRPNFRVAILSLQTSICTVVPCRSVVKRARGRRGMMIRRTTQGNVTIRYRLHHRTSGTSPATLLLLCANGCFVR